MNIGPDLHYAVIGDLVGSRQLPDRSGAHRDLRTALARVNGVVRAAQPLAATVGDEFQGVFTALPEALLATVLVRVFLPDGMDARAGIGCGALEVFEPAVGSRPPVQDGPAWWAARDAINTAEARADRPRWSYLRTWYDEHETARGRAGLSVSAVNAFLVCRDQMVDRLDRSTRHLLRLALTGATQKEMAMAEGISQSAVSQRLARSGVTAIRDAHQLMREEES